MAASPSSILILSNFFPPDVIGGYELGCSRIATRLAEDGFNIHVATSMARHDDSPQAVSPSSSGIKVHRIFPPLWDYQYRPALDKQIAHRVSKSLRSALVDQSNALALKNLIDSLDFDLVYVFNFIGLGPISILETLLTTGKPLVVHLMDDLDAAAHLIVKSPGMLKRFEQIKQYFHAISCSKGTLKRNTRIGSYGTHQVIYSGIEALPKTNRLRELPEDTFHLVYSGQIIEQKGIRQLLNAYHQLLKRLPERQLQLHLIGDAPNDFPNIIRRQEHHLIQSGKLVMHGKLPYHELSGLLSQMNLGVYPLPDFEAFGYAPVESLELGIPVILNSHTGASEMFPADYPLFIHDRSDINALTDIMEKAVTDPDIRLQAIQSYQSIRDSFLFEDYTYPQIKNVLTTATPLAPPKSFPDVMRLSKAWTDYVQAFPQRVTH